jgi:hypothetical protein
MKTGTKHILAAFSRQIKQIVKDRRLHGSHVSLYAALFVCYRQSGYQNPFPITRKTVMGFSKVASIATYHKCMRQLNEYGYIRYKPSYDPVKGSLVYWPAEQQGGKDRPESVRSENFQCESACIEPVRSDKFHSE